MSANLNDKLCRIAELSGRRDAGFRISETSFRSLLGSALVIL